MKEMKKLTALLLVMSMIFSMAACSSKASEEPAPEPDSLEEEAPETEDSAISDGDTIRLAFNDRNRTEPFHISLYEGLKRATEEAGWEYQDAINDGDTMKHIQANESFVTKNVDIIVDFTCVPETGEVCANAAAEAGIPFITVDVDYGENAYFFGVDGYDAGSKLGEAIIPILDERFDGQVDWIVLLSAIAAGPTVELRLDGVVDAVQDAYGEVPADHYVHLDCTDDMKTATYTRDFLNAHPDESNILFIGISDDRGYAATGQINALGRQDDCALVSFNGDPAAREDLKDQADNGTNSAWIASIAFNPHKYGEQIVAYAEEILAGNAEKTKNCITTVLTPDNIHDYLKEIGEE